MKKPSTTKQLIAGFGVIVALVVAVTAVRDLGLPMPTDATESSVATSQRQDEAADAVQQATDGQGAVKDEGIQGTQPSEEATLPSSGDAVATQDDSKPTTAESTVVEEVRTDADGNRPDAPEPVVEAFSYPEDRAFEPQVAIVQVDDSTDVEAVAKALERQGQEATVSELADGVLRVELSEQADAQNVVNSLVVQDVVKQAQPNYCYAVMEDGTLAAAEPEEAHAAQERGDERAAQTPSDDALPQSGDVRGGASAEDQATDRAEADKAEADKSEADKAAEPALVAQATSTNDPLTTEQWALDSVRARDAWDLARTDRRVTVAMLDLGCEIGHEDLRDNIVSPYNAVNDTSDVSPINGGTNDHGTHVAGIISATANNGLGVAGVSYNAQIMPVRVVNDSGYAYSDKLIRAYDYVISKKDELNVRVINLSMGMAGTISEDNAFIKKISEAYDKGIVTVAAAGNQSSSNTGRVPYGIYPADFDPVVSVISLEDTGTGVARAATSNYNEAGEYVKDISAPGVGILSTKPKGNYGTKSGTSMAAPLVSGVLALEFAVSPGLSADGAVRNLYSTARKLTGTDFDSQYGWGEVDAYAAVSALLGSGTDQGRQEAVDDVVDQRDADAASSVERQIASLPSADAITLSDLPAVLEARSAYDQLTEAQRALVGNSGELIAVEERIGDLQRDEAVASSLQYHTHVQDVGWQDWVSGGEMAGTSGQSLRLEAMEMRLGEAPYAGSIQYRTHVQDVGWQDWVSDGDMAGTSGQSLRLEAVQVQLTGDMASHYDVWYHVHCQDVGWMGWAKNGELSGTSGFGRRLEAIEVRIQPSGSPAPGSTDGAFLVPVRYQTHVQDIGWQGWVADGAMAGTSGRSLRLEALNAMIPDNPFGGSIRYRTHVQDIGWQGWVSDGDMAGTSGQSLRLEALQMELDGELAERFDVWYRVHCQDVGWMGWACNGGRAGTQGFSRRLEALEVRLLPKGSTAPGPVDEAFLAA